MIHVLNKSGGGWKREWVDSYHLGHRGMQCLMLDIVDMDSFYKTQIEQGVSITKPEWLTFKWFFNMLTRTMPWRNCYLPFFKGVPFQIGFQEMKDKESRAFMEAYMVPNSREEDISGIYHIHIAGPFTDEDFAMITKVFKSHQSIDETKIVITLENHQTLSFIRQEEYSIEVITDSKKEKTLKIENILDKGCNSILFL